MDFIKEFWEFIKQRKKYWLIAPMIILLLFGFIIVASGGSTLTPFIYAIF